MAINLNSLVSHEDSNVSAEMNFLGNTYLVSNFSTSFSQFVDEKFEPQAEVHGAILSVSFQQVPDSKMLQWASSKFSRKSGEIVFKNETGTPPLKIQFTEAACVKLSHQVISGGGTVTNIHISPKEVSFNGVLLNNGWRE